MKKIIFIFLTILFISLSYSNSAHAEELYFNDSGDLVFALLDKRATSGIRYKTVGWAIKRYDDELYAIGQTFVNIPRTGYIYQITDPNNPEYIYTTFIIDGEMILNYIGHASQEWKNQLKNYGGYVYIDSVMTICEYGTDMGGMYSSGETYGEVYNTYEGIRNARGWADGEKLRAYYNLMVEYPCLLTGIELILTDETVKEHVFDSSVASSFKIGSSSLENEIYDVSQGIPSGEELYLYGTADSFRYCVNWTEVTGYAQIPVKITKVYHMEWIDRWNVYHEESRSVNRWYYVRRDYSYVRIDSAEKYDLTEAVVSSECFDDVTISGFTPAGLCSAIQYGDSSGHIQAEALEYYVGTAPLYSYNNQRPVIPDDDYQSIAEELVSELVVWSDSLEINNVKILSDEECSSSGRTIETSVNVPKHVISKNQIMIPIETENQAHYKSSVELKYSSGAKNEYVYNYNINTVAVHAPVVMRANIKGSRDNNENLTPSETDLVIGDTFIIYHSSYGNHRDIRKYGLRDYTKYTGKRYVKMSFPVIYGKELYHENTWIETDSYVMIFRVPEHVKEGEYDIECIAAAVNLPSVYSDTRAFLTVSEKRANFDIGDYCALDTIHVTIIGKIYGLTVENSEECYKSGIKTVFPEPLECGEETLPIQIEKQKSTDNIFTLRLYANGIGDEPEEMIDMDVSYSVLEENHEGVIITKPVDIYKAEDEKFTADTLVKIEEKINIPMEQAVKIRDGVYSFSAELEIPDKLIIVEKGRNISDINIKSNYILYDKTFIVNLDIYAADGDGRKLSYENSENELQGYCNMWKKEGYNVDKFDRFTLKYGDTLLIGMDGMMKNEERIIGTH